MGTVDSFDEKTNKPVVRSAHYLPGDAHCCVSAINVTPRWNGSRFVQTGIRTKLSDNGKRNSGASRQIDITGAWQVAQCLDRQNIRSLSGSGAVTYCRCRLYCLRTPQ
jgi:hypothetical protein